jgi:neutral trehalase
MRRTPDEPQPLDELASRMIAYRERAAVARRLAQAISDQRATTGLIEHAEKFERKAEAIAAQLVEFAHRRRGE